MIFDWRVTIFGGAISCRFFPRPSRSWAGVLPRGRDTSPGVTELTEDGLTMWTKTRTEW